MLKQSKLVYQYFILFEIGVLEWVASKEDKMIENKQIWFEHVLTRKETEAVEIVKEYILLGRAEVEWKTENQVGDIRE